MKVLIIFLQIIAFPLSFLLISLIFQRVYKKSNNYFSSSLGGFPVNNRQSVKVNNYDYNRTKQIKENTKLYKFFSAINFTITTYIVGGIILFPLFLIFKPIKINGISYLQGICIPVYWSLSWIISIVLCVIFSYLFFFRIHKTNRNYKTAFFLGFFQLPIMWFFEIIIYVYIRQTIPTIFDYFFGKNFPWLNINWILAIFAPLITVYIIKNKIHKKVD